MENPYATPQSDAGENASNHRPQGPGWVNHIRVVAIFMMIQGAMELVMGVFLAVMAFALPLMMQASAKNSPAGVEPLPESVAWFTLALYLSIGILSFAAGVLHIFAGYRNYQLRNRTFGIVSLFFGLVTLLTCYCFPTSLGLAIYGLIVYFNYEVSVAFQMRQKGREVNEILALFTTAGPPQKYY